MIEKLSASQPLGGLRQPPAQAGCQRMSNCGWPLLLLAFLGLARPAGAQPLTAPWPVTDGAPPQQQDLPGWHCTQALALTLPGPGRQVAACRRTGGQASAELRLLQVDRSRAGPPRVHELARLRDANQARLRLFTARPPCPAGAAACLDGLLLVDQRDESSCYGTQVLVLPAGRPARALGFINELRGGRAEAGACIGPWAQVGAVPGGALIHLPGPLMLAGRSDGALRGMDVGGVRYRIAAARPVLKRQVLAAR